jgi:hypothetical protein
MSLAIARISGEALAAAATETLIQIVTGSTRKAKIKEWGISFNGTDATDEPVLVELLRQSTAGTSSALTMVQNDPDDPAIIATALQDFSAEPTAGDVLWSEYITPAGGFDRVQLPLGEEIVVDVSSRIGLRVTTATGVTPTAAAYIKFEE